MKKAKKAITATSSFMKALEANHPKGIRVRSEEVSEPVAVRYAFRNWGPGNLKSNFGIPAVPFRTDDWDDLER